MSLLIFYATTISTTPSDTRTRYENLCHDMDRIHQKRYFLYCFIYENDVITFIKFYVSESIFCQLDFLYKFLQ